MTDHASTAGLTGQLQAPGPPGTSVSLPLPMQKLSSGIDNSTNDGYGKKVDITASLIVGDRSRNEGDVGIVKAGNKGTRPHEEEVVLAGPMRDWDPLYMLLVILGLMTTICATLGIFLPYSFTLFRPFFFNDPKNYGLFDSKPCSSFSKKSGGDESAKRDVCYEGSRSNGLGSWVLLVQILSCMGLGLSLINLLLQLVNLCLSPRNKWMHSTSLYIMAATGSILLLAGHVVHNRSVWTDKISFARESYIRVEPLSSGLFLVCSILASWSCVVIHVTTHATGPLSKNTRFLHTVTKVQPMAIMPPQDIMALQDIKVEAPVMVEEPRRESVHSTSL